MLFSELRNNMKAWLDDFNAHGKTEAELLRVFERFFQICQEKRLCLSAVKSVFFATRIMRCGKIISGDEYTFDPTRINDLRQMDEPNTAAELQEFIYCCRWMLYSIPDFAARVSLLTELLEKASKKSGKRTKGSIKNIGLNNLSWGTTNVQVLHELQDTLRNAVRLSYLKP